MKAKILENYRWVYYELPYNKEYSVVTVKGNYVHIQCNDKVRIVGIHQCEYFCEVI